MTVNMQKRHRYRIRRVTRPVPSREISPAKRIYFLLTAVSASGVLIGALSGVYHGDMAAIRTPVGFADAFAGSFASVMLYILLLFLSGTSPAGAVCGYFLCLFKGMGAGFLSAEIFRSGAFSANGAEVINVLPFEAVSMAAVIFAARENIRMSRLISERLFIPTENRGEGKDCFGLYIMKFGVITLLAAAAALADGLMAVISGNMPL